MSSKNFLIILFLLAITRCCAADRRPPLRLCNGQTTSTDFAPLSDLDGLYLKLAVLKQQEKDARVVTELERAVDSTRRGQNDGDGKTIASQIEQLRATIRGFEKEAGGAITLRSVRSLRIQQLRDKWQGLWQKSQPLPRENDPKIVGMAARILQNSRRAERNDVAVAARRRSEVEMSQAQGPISSTGATMKAVGPLTAV